MSFIVTQENLRGCLKVEGHTCCSGFGFATQPNPGEFSLADTILPSISNSFRQCGGEIAYVKAL
jgi:hypothetical protein